MLPKTERPDIIRSLPTRLRSELMVTNDTFSAVVDILDVVLKLPFISTIAVTDNKKKKLIKLVMIYKNIDEIIIFL